MVHARFTLHNSPSVAVATLSRPVVHRPEIAWRAAIPPSRACRHVAEQDWLAGPSHSGNEPASSSGTGTGMHLCHTLDHPAATREVPRSWLARNNGSRPQAIVKIIERLFEDAIELVHGHESPCESMLIPALRTLDQASGRSAPTGTSNEASTEASNQTPNAASNVAYLGHLLAPDVTQWQYLNLVVQMSALSEFAVTSTFVQRALKALCN